MKNFSLYLFGTVLLLFAFSVILTMYSMVSEEGEGNLFGINLSYFSLPLLAVNFCICIANINHIELKGIKLLIVIWLIIVSLNVLFIGTNKAVNLVRVNIWTTSFLSAYLLSRSNKHTFAFLKKVFVVIFGFSLYFFWLGKIYQMGNLKYGMEGASNAIYCLLTVVPFLLFLKEKKIRFLILLLVFLCTAFSNKRGATIIILAILIPTLRSLFPGKKNKGRRFIMSALLSLGFLFILFYLGESYLGGRIIERFDEMQDTGGSGRLVIWEYLLASYNSSSLFEQLFGHGHAAAALTGIQIAAHNDFIEVLYDYGIIGLIVYLSIHIYMIRRFIILKKTQNPLYLSFFTMYAIFFLMSMVSILIVQQRYLIYMAVYWGCLEGYKYNIKA